MNYYQKNHCLILERHSNFKPSKRLEVNKCYKLEKGHITYMNPLSHVIKNSELSEKIQDTIDINLYNEKVFAESFHIFEDVDINGKKDNREWAYVRAGIIKDDNSQLTVSKTVTNENDLNEIFHELDEMFEVTRLDYDEKNNIDEETIFMFKPQASAVIANEILGHTLEEDNYNRFTKKMGEYAKGIHSNKEIVFKEFNNYKGFNLRKIDDEGHKVQDEKIIIEDGDIKNVISSKEINDEDGKMTSRMRGTILTGKNSINKNFKNCIKVYNISESNVDFESQKVEFTIELAEKIDGENKHQLPKFTIKIDIAKVLDGIIDIGNDVSIYQNYSVKKDQIIDVFSGAPTMVMKGFSLVD